MEIGGVCSMLKRIMKWCARLGLTFHVIKTVLAAAISWSVASLMFGDHFSYFAPLAAVLTVQLTIADTMEKGLYRILGVIIGVVVTAVVVPYVGQNFLGVAVVLLIGMGAATAFKLNPQIISQIGVSSVMVMSFQQAQGYATGRIIETIVGALIAVVVQITIHPENKVPSAVRRNVNICQKLAERMQQLAHSVSTQQNDLMSLQYSDADLMSLSRKLNDAYCNAQKSLKYNFIYRKDSRKLAALQDRVDTVQKILIAVSSVNYAVQEIGTKYLKQLPIEAALMSSAECIRLYGRLLKQTTPKRHEALEQAIHQAYDDQFLLFDAFKEQQAKAETLMEIGSLFADLHRIVAEIERSSSSMSSNHALVKASGYMKTKKKSTPSRIAN